MFMRLKVLILLGILLSSSISVMAGSSTQSNFNIGGCFFEGEDVGVARGECSTGGSFGEFYCDDDGFGWVTGEVGLGCSMGNTGYKAGDDYCCPEDMACMDVGDGEFQCKRTIDRCSSNTNSGDCANAGCIWMDITEECVNNVLGYDCGYYNDETVCDGDKHGIGQNGVGTELSGTYIECADGTTYSIMTEYYKCDWYTMASGGEEECRVTYSAVETGYGYGAIPNMFSCSNSYNLGDCVDGKQAIIWTSTPGEVQGLSSIPEGCLEAFNCDGGMDEGFCGEETIKLPGFSLFALFASLFVIGMYYFFREDSKI